MFGRLGIYATVCGVCLLHVTVNSETHAGEVSFYFEGTVTRFSHVPDDLTAQLDALGVTIGSTITGTYTFDSLATDQAEHAPYRGLFAVDMIAFGIGDFKIESANAMIDVQLYDGLDRLADTYAIYDHTDLSSPIDGYPSLVFDFLLIDLSASAFIDDSLPLEPPDLDNFVSSTYIRFFTAHDRYPHDVNFAFTRFAIVPEPSALALLACGCVTVMRKRKPLAMRRMNGQDVMT